MGPLMSRAIINFLRSASHIGTSILIHHILFTNSQPKCAPNDPVLWYCTPVGLEDLVASDLIEPLS